MDEIKGKSGKIIFEDVNNQKNGRKASKRPIKEIKNLNGKFIAFIDQNNKKQLIPSDRIIRLVVETEEGNETKEIQGRWP